MRGNKVETQLIMSPEMNDRVRLLAAVRGETRAETLRGALEWGLLALEPVHAPGVQILNEIAANRGTTVNELVDFMLDSRPRVKPRDLEARLREVPA